MVNYIGCYRKIKLRGRLEEFVGFGNLEFIDEFSKSCFGGSGERS